MFVKFLKFLLAISLFSCLSCSKKDPVPTTGTLKFKVSLESGAGDKTVVVTLRFDKDISGTGKPALYKSSSDMKVNDLKIFDAGEYLPGYYYYTVSAENSYYEGYAMIVANKEKIIDCNFNY